MKPKLYMMCGISGSGKTTFAKKFAEENDLYYICPDDFYKMLNGDDRIHTNEFEVWMTLFRALHMAEQQGRNTIFDTNNPTHVSRLQILDWFPGFEFHLIYIYAAPELCLKNNSSRRRVIPEDEMKRMIRTFEPPSEYEVLKYASVTKLENVDNTGLKPMEEV